ncbi:hypothetical protein DIPPA_03758 [Diplonema papillatum]|nr:hypothetical protein DIPPA_03758 [Diplonema papillatum]
MAVVLAAAAVFCCVAAADDPLRRPTVRELPQERNLTGMFTAAWADVQQQQQLSRAGLRQPFRLATDTCGCLKKTS